MFVPRIKIPCPATGDSPNFTEVVTIMKIFAFTIMEVVTIRVLVGLHGDQIVIIFYLYGSSYVVVLYEK